MRARPKYNQEKLAELILYVAHRCQDQERFGSVKLNKILFYADFLAYESRGEPITGATYRRLPNGPAPKQLVPVRERLEKAKALAMQQREVGRVVEKRPIALRPAKMQVFRPEEISFVEMAISGLAASNASQVSEISHRFAGWALARENEEIPYETVVLPSGPIDLTMGEMQWALEQVRAA